jgi:hypothetical protein
MKIEELEIFEKCLSLDFSGFPIYTNFESWLLNNDEIPFGVEEDRDFIDNIKRSRLIEISEMVFNDNIKWIYFSNGKLNGITEHGAGGRGPNHMVVSDPHHIYFDKKKWREIRINSLI